MSDTLLAIAVMIGSLVYLYADSKLPHLTLGDPVGLKVFPAIIGIGLFLSAIVLLLERRKQRGSQPATESTEQALPGDRLVLLGFACWTAIYYAVLESAGYLISTVLYIFLLLSYFNSGKWRLNAAVALGFALFAQVLFANLLGVALPSGPVSFF
jgi:putative tricarboxylic transport membrane protein